MFAYVFFVKELIDVINGHTGYTDQKTISEVCSKIIVFIASIAEISRNLFMIIILLSSS